MPLVTMLGEANTSLVIRRHPGSRGSGVVLVGRIGRTQGALGRESALPLTGRRAEAVLVLRVLGGESNPVNPSAGSATEGVRGRFTTFSPGR
jgi:hypothetical protein